MKNCCVSLLSAKHYNPDSDVALVTNIDIPNEFEKLLMPLQLFAYYVALQRGCDIDKPRNLAKSVTVE